MKKWQEKERLQLSGETAGHAEGDTGQERGDECEGLAAFAGTAHVAAKRVGEEKRERSRSRPSRRRLR